MKRRLDPENKGLPGARVPTYGHFAKGGYAD
jgi:hypothetical protein